MDDALIIAAYTPPYHRGEIAQLARLWGVQPHHIARRARVLGMSSIMEGRFQRGTVKAWSDDEIRLLQRFPQLLHAQMHHLFNQHGYQRTKNSIAAKRLALGWRAFIEREESEAGYTASGVSDLMGVHPATVTRWIRRGLLKGAQEEGPGQNHKFRIGRHPLRTFLKNNIHLWEPGKMDKYWLVDILTNP